MNEARREGRAAALVVVVACVAMVALLAWLGRSLTFFFDEWDFLLRRRHLGADSLLAPHNGHLSTIPALTYVVLRHTVSAVYWPYQAVVIGLHLAAVALLFVTARRRLGPWGAAAAAGFLLTAGRAWQDLLWPFQMGFVSSMAAGLAALWVLDRAEPRNEWKAGLFVAAALLSSGLGVPVAAAVGVETLLGRGAAATARALGPALAGYGVWYLARGTSEADLANLDLVPGYVARSAEGAVGSLLGLDPGRAALVATIVVAAVTFGLVVTKRATPRLVGAVVGALVFWGLTALSRGSLGEPAASRYLYPGAVFVLVALTEAAARIDRRRARTLVALAAAVILGPAALSNVDALRRGAAGLRETSAFVRAELGALEVAAAMAPPEFRPDPARMPQVTAAAYLAAADGEGSPADRPAEIVRRRPAVRRAADAVLVRLLTESGRSSAALGKATEAASCRAVEAGESEHPVPGTGVVTEAGAGPVTMKLRRFSEGFADEPALTVPAGAEGAVRLVPDRSQPGWRLLVSSTGPFRLCAVREP